MSIKPKIKPIKTIEIELGIARHFGIRQHIIVPNISWGLHGMHECDMFLIKKSGYCIEVEIKISKSDLLADFKKGHHHQDNRIKEFYYAIPIKLLESCENLIPEHIGIIVCEKIKNRKYIHTQIRRKTTINKKARKLTNEEILKVAKLGCMRIWRLKEKIINNEK